MRKKIYFLLFNILFAIVIASFLMMTVKNINLNQEQKKEIAKIEEELKIENEKKEKLLKDIDIINESDKIEKIARDQLNMKKEGETVYKILEDGSLEEVENEENEENKENEIKNNTENSDEQGE